MITPGMTYTEIKHELHKEYEQVRQSIDLKYSRFKKQILKYKIRENRTLAEYNSPNKNRYLFVFDRYHGAFSSSIFCHYENQRGFNFLSINDDYGQFNITFYTPHYLKRYRERMHHDNTLTPLQTVKRWINGYSSACNYLIDFPAKNDRQKRICIFNAEGCSLGIADLKGDFYILKTFISTEMLRGSQLMHSVQARKGIREEMEHYERLNDVHYWSRFMKKLRGGKNRRRDTGLAA
jgi:hypothetical protein